MSDEPRPALKELLGEKPHRVLADALPKVYPAFDKKRFLALTLTGIEERSLMQRLRRATEALRETLPSGFPAAVKVLRDVSVQLPRSFANLVYPDFVGLYGAAHYETSLEALKYFTTLGSSEFGIRPFLQADLKRTLATMTKWAEDPDEHVRRLASEGSRPRLPWATRVAALIKDPTLTTPILEKLLNDPSLYVRKSVANHLNDLSKDHPEWLIGWLKAHDLQTPNTRWIMKRALRTLIKKGHPAALALVGATGAAAVGKVAFSVKPKRLALGGDIALDLSLRSTGKTKQHLVVDYAIHYVKKSADTSHKVFKWKAVDLAPNESLRLSKRQRIKDYTTRKHYPGKHVVEVLINGAVVARDSFALTV
ncbi:DNA alkylation repair protein [Opitutaceae bacterium EW11]|nr:DNA alkylation repair protein [Opitutaceae bacterium EW11]